MYDMIAYWLTSQPHNAKVLGLILSVDDCTDLGFIPGL